MGWAARNELKVKRYRVVRATAYTWNEVWDGTIRRDRVQHFQRIAVSYERYLHARCERVHVAQVNYDNGPQLRFEMVVLATDAADARRRVAYRIERALAQRIPAGNGRSVRLNPPWAKMTVRKVS
jgi:hypothetical protein